MPHAGKVRRHHFVDGFRVVLHDGCFPAVLQPFHGGFDAGAFGWFGCHLFFLGERGQGQDSYCEY